MSVSVEIKDNNLFTYTPYNPEFPTKARRLGGRYLGGIAWRFDPRDEVRVRALLVSVYGTDGSPEDPK